MRVSGSDSYALLLLFDNNIHWVVWRRVWGVVGCLSSRFYVQDAEGKQTVTPLYEAWFHWQTDKYRMADSIAEWVTANRPVVLNLFWPATPCRVPHPPVACPRPSIKTKFCLSTFILPDCYFTWAYPYLSPLFLRQFLLNLYTLWPSIY